MRIKSGDGHDEKTESDALPAADAVKCEQVLSEKPNPWYLASHDGLDDCSPRRQGPERADRRQVAPSRSGWSKTPPFDGLWRRTDPRKSSHKGMLIC